MQDGATSRGSSRFHAQQIVMRTGRQPAQTVLQTHTHIGLCGWSYSGWSPSGKPPIPPLGKPLLKNPPFPNPSGGSSTWNPYPGASQANKQTAMTCRQLWRRGENSAKFHGWDGKSAADQEKSPAATRKTLALPQL